MENTVSTKNSQFTLPCTGSTHNSNNSETNEAHEACLPQVSPSTLDARMPTGDSSHTEEVMSLQDVKKRLIAPRLPPQHGGMTIFQTDGSSMVQMARQAQRGEIEGLENFVASKAKHEIAMQHIEYYEKINEVHQRYDQLEASVKPNAVGNGSIGHKIRVPKEYLEMARENVALVAKALSSGEKNRELPLNEVLAVLGYSQSFQNQDESFPIVGVYENDDIPYHILVTLFEEPNVEKVSSYLKPFLKQGLSSTNENVLAISSYVLERQKFVFSFCAQW